MLSRRKDSKFHGSLAAIGIAVLAVFAGALVIHYGWNLAVPELFGGEEMNFKNAFGIVIILGSAAALLRWGLQPDHSRVSHSNNAKSGE